MKALSRRAWKPRRYISFHEAQSENLEDDWHEVLLELWGRYSRSGYLVWEATKLRAMPLLDVCRSQQNARQYEQYA